VACFVGIDGGGTKTSAVVANEEGTILGHTTAGPSNLIGSTPERIREEFRRIKQGLNPYVPNWWDCVIFAGIAGTSHPKHHEQVFRCLQVVFDEGSRIVLDHDGLNALGSVTYGDPGVVQIAGTGSITFGLGKRGERCRIGGWGYLLGDEGSGFSLGKRALVQVMKAYDGRGPATELTELALCKWKLESPEDLIPYIYGERFRERIASFTFELFKAFRNGDGVAVTIVEEAAEELALAIHTALKRLDLTHQACPVGLIGGAFQSPLVDLVRKKLEQLLPVMPQLIRSETEPVIGALVWAFKIAGLDAKKLLLQG